MNKQVLLQTAFLLHRRSYRESSFLVELFTKEYGRITAIAKGMQKGRSGYQGLLQPFLPLLVSCSGKGELLTLTHVEMNQKLLHLHGECLFAGFYLNELLMCLLQKWDAHPKLFTIYENTLEALAKSTLEEKILRVFEKHLLNEIGYGLLPKKDDSLHHISKEKYYRFVPEQGFLESALGEETKARANVFSGKSLLAIAKEDWQDGEDLQAAKRLSRLALMPLLGNRPIYSRQLFMQMGEKNNDE